MRSRLLAVVVAVSTDAATVVVVVVAVSACRCFCCCDSDALAILAMIADLLAQVEFSYWKGLLLARYYCYSNDTH